jgi:hypothetical protein
MPTEGIEGIEGIGATGGRGVVFTRHLLHVCGEGVVDILSSFRRQTSDDRGSTMPASPKIETPTEFARWVETKTLFDDGTPVTETSVTNGSEPDVRLASGKSPDGWHFYISMTTAEEPLFWEVYKEWISRNPGGIHTVSGTAFVVSPKPPGCGTSTTPQCEAA